jgi:hypothetical protein
MTMHQTPDDGARPEPDTRRLGVSASTDSTLRRSRSVLRAPAVVGSLVLVILVLGASAGAYALTRSPARSDVTPVPALGSGGPVVGDVGPVQKTP